MGPAHLQRFLRLQIPLVDPVIPAAVLREANTPTPRCPVDSQPSGLPWRGRVGPSRRRAERHTVSSRGGHGLESSIQCPVTTPRSLELQNKSFGKKFYMIPGFQQKRRRLARRAVASAEVEQPDRRGSYQVPSASRSQAINARVAPADGHRSGRDSRARRAPTRGVEGGRQPFKIRKAG